MNTPTPSTPPPGSSITLTRRDPGLTAHLPPRGLHFRAVMFAGIVLIFLVGSLLIVVDLVSGLIDGSQTLTGFLLGLGGVAVMLIGCLLVGAYVVILITERAEIDLIDKTLLITRKNRFRLKQWEFTADQLDSVDSSAYSPLRNDPYIHCLAVTPREGKTLELFLNRPIPDLEYLAKLIETQLDLESNDYDEDEDESDFPDEDDE
ncbi:MAG: hypothetical protein AAF797_16510 [Planctomycetota bacterium]